MQQCVSRIESLWLLGYVFYGQSKYVFCHCTCPQPHISVCPYGNFRPLVVQTYVANSVQQTALRAKRSAAIRIFLQLFLHLATMSLFAVIFLVPSQAHSSAPSSAAVVSVTVTNQPHARFT